MSLLAHAYLCRLTPVFEGKRSGNRNRELPFRGKLCIVTKHVIAQCASLLPRGAAEIAAKAGVTERTFFRHFPDKREVLFDGDVAFTEAVTAAVRNAPKTLGPWDTLFFAFDSVKQRFVENRPFTEPRQRVIASSPALQERATAKARSLTAAVASAL